MSWLVIRGLKGNFSLIAIGKGEEESTPNASNTQKKYFSFPFSFFFLHGRENFFFRSLLFLPSSSPPLLSLSLLHSLPHPNAFSSVILSSNHRHTFRGFMANIHTASVVYFCQQHKTHSFIGLPREREKERKKE